MSPSQQGPTREQVIAHTKSQIKVREINLDLLNRERANEEKRIELATQEWEAGEHTRDGRLKRDVSIEASMIHIARCDIAMEEIKGMIVALKAQLHAIENPSAIVSPVGSGVMM